MTPVMQVHMLASPNSNILKRALQQVQRPTRVCVRVIVVVCVRIACWCSGV